ncbi:hypothetical protein SS50377_22656 [Spironucleus salmonicida]|uniref:Uncharacterized protein n=1 Tax=Spironucleus salmonicida TaxID=348837 RepID=V6LMD2_9EUKA|nr:hypothetical protein SS50377_22656 [Spironucleus salmonicida]|eukprot:EST45852.1 Hypothetical protein SS50377_14194 [Spironucleus salmonicida]
MYRLYQIKSTLSKYQILLNSASELAAKFANSTATFQIKNRRMQHFQLLGYIYIIWKFYKIGIVFCAKQVRKLGLALDNSDLAFSVAMTCFGQNLMNRRDRERNLDLRENINWFVQIVNRSTGRQNDGLHIRFDLVIQRQNPSERLDAAFEVTGIINNTLAEDQKHDNEKLAKRTSQTMGCLLCRQIYPIEDKYRSKNVCAVFGKARSICDGVTILWCQNRYYMPRLSLVWQCCISQVNCCQNNKKEYYCYFVFRISGNRLAEGISYNLKI